MFYKITLQGRVPSKKNSKRRIKRGNHIFMVPSEAHEAWHTEQMWVLKEMRVPLVQGVTRVELKFYAGDKRKGDLSNKAESIMDLLVDAGVLEDDNWFVVPKLNLTLGGVDKENPRAEIEIHK